MHKSKLETKLDPPEAPKPKLVTLKQGYTPWVMCLTAPEDHPSWQGREWVRLDRFSTKRCTDKDYVAQYAHDIAAAIQEVHGGQWCGVVRPEGQIPENQPFLQKEEARKWAEAHILDGPEGPGRRFLMSRPGALVPVLKTLLPEPPRKRTATRADIDALLKDVKNLSPAPLRADGPFFDRENAEQKQVERMREPGEEG
jgi:hypothetical protein